jgi:hypothetical protein
MMTSRSNGFRLLDGCIMRELFHLTQSVSHVNLVRIPLILILAALNNDYSAFGQTGQ